MDLYPGLLKRGFSKLSSTSQTGHQLLEGSQDVVIGFATFWGFMYMPCTYMGTLGSLELAGVITSSFGHAMLCSRTQTHTETTTPWQSPFSNAKGPGSRRMRTQIHVSCRLIPFTFFLQCPTSRSNSCFEQLPIPPVCLM